MQDPRETARFFGRWHATVDQEELFLEFLPDGRLAYTGLFGEDTTDFMGMQHPLDFGKPNPGPTWELRGTHLVVYLRPAKEFTFEYTFSTDGNELSLKSLRTNESLTFSKKRA
jgi:hypothetical protein